MPSDKLPPEIRAMIERILARTTHRDGLAGDLEELALASLRHAAMECVKIEAACVFPNDDTGEKLKEYAASLAEETMLPGQGASSRIASNGDVIESRLATEPASGSAYEPVTQWRQEYNAKRRSPEREGLTREQIARLRDSKYPWAQLCKEMYALPENVNTADEWVRNLCALALRALDAGHGHGVSFENWLGYQPWQSVGGGKWYGADTVLAAWNAGSTARRFDSGPTSEEETKRINEWRSAMLQVFVNESGVDWLCNLAIDGLRWAGKGARE